MKAYANIAADEAFEKTITDVTDEGTKTTTTTTVNKVTSPGKI